MGTSSSLPVYDMKRLDLMIKGNSLSKVPYSFPEGHPLEFMDLSDNLIKELPINLKFLKTLDLTLNNITTLPPQMINAICSYKSLSELRLTRNKLTDYPKELAQLQNITKLLLASNKLNSISSLDFVEILDISSNLFEQIFISEK